MNPPLTPPRRGSDTTPTTAWSPLGRGRGWVGSWKASFRSCACIGTMNHDEAAAGALASWTAAVLCRFCARGPDPKAPEDWRTPKPRGVPAGSWRVQTRFHRAICSLALLGPVRRILEAKQCLPCLRHQEDSFVFAVRKILDPDAVRVAIAQVDASAFLRRN